MFPNQKRQIYTSLLNMANDIQEYPQKLLAGLGKSTKRGVKKCTYCGIYNGTRSSICKNKQCSRILKTCEEKSKANLEAVKLLTNTEKQVYSVKVWDMGPHYRGFVQLPVLNVRSEDDPNIYSEVALCFIDSCQNSFDNSILKCHEEGVNSSNNPLCTHIKSAIQSQSKASPLQLNSELLNSFKIKDEILEKLRLYDSEKEGPFVQRVSKSVLAVKCQVNAKHPLGYLHFTFIKGKGKETFEKFYCSCSDFSVSELPDNEFKQKCFHYYACIWAIASDVKYKEDFSTFLENEFPCEDGTLNIILKVPISQVVEPTACSSTLNNCSKKPINLKMKTKTFKKNVKKSKLRRKKETIKICQKLMPKILPIEIKVLEDGSKSNNTVSWDFIDWLSFVTESINGTMQFENYGIVNTMVLQIPESFYKCLAERIPALYEALQDGSCFVHYVMNILHLKEIFDTPQVKLKISKKFVHSDQKGYVEFDENHDSDETSYQCPFIYFLNVGQSTVDESDNTNNSFYIEWSPSLFNVSNVGQLRLQYRYGRKST